MALDYVKNDEKPVDKPAEPKKGKKPGRKAKKRVTYFCKIAPLVHPYQKVLIPAAPPGIQLDMDAWLEVQMEANRVVAYEE